MPLSWATLNSGTNNGSSDGTFNSGMPSFKYGRRARIDFLIQLLSLGSDALQICMNDAGIFLKYFFK